MSLVDKANLVKSKTPASEKALKALSGKTSMVENKKPDLSIENQFLIPVPEEFQKVSGMNKKIQGDYPVEYHQYLTDVAYKRTKENPLKKKVSAKDILIEALNLHCNHLKG